MIGIPGLIDLQVNGFRGVDFSSPTLSEESFREACSGLFEKGTTAFLPTLITSPIEIYHRNLQLIEGVMEKREYKGHLLGFHLEGPFISREPGARGIHNPEWILNPDISLFDQLQEWACGKIRLLTLAADLEGAEELTRYAVKKGVTVSLGHHLATEDELDRLVKAGATALTHMGNGIPDMINRHKNPIWAGLAQDDLTAMVITDGHHLPVSVLKTIIRAKGVKRLIVTSDSSPSAGLPPGRYRSQTGEVILDETGLLYDPSSGYLAGSSATMLECMNLLASSNLLRLEELLLASFYNPLNLIRVDPQSIVKGKPLRFNPEENLFYPSNFSS